MDKDDPQIEQLSKIQARLWNLECENKYLNEKLATMIKDKQKTENDLKTINSQLKSMLTLKQAYSTSSHSKLQQTLLSCSPNKRSTYNDSPGSIQIQKVSSLTHLPAKPKGHTFI